MVRKAVLGDASAIYALIESFSSTGVMLPRPVSDITDNLRDFFVYDEGKGLLGACALHLSSTGIGEIRSLAVVETKTRRGIGSKLVTACLDEARIIGFKQVFALTYRTEFFVKLGFMVIDKEVLPHKIWGDCVRCTKFPNCDETAVIKDL